MSNVRCLVAITPEQCEQYLNSLPPMQQVTFLAELGHELTVVARKAYEFQGPGVDDPRWLRDLNEISHRLFPQIAALVSGSPAPFPNDALVSWLPAEGKPTLRTACLATFERVVARKSST